MLDLILIFCCFSTVAASVSDIVNLLQMKQDELQFQTICALLILLSNSSILAVSLIYYFRLFDVLIPT